MKGKVSLAVVRRLPQYYRYLKELENAGITKSSSRDMGEAMGLTASQIRQDLNCFGSFGQQGYGYNVSSLIKEIAYILAIEEDRPFIVIGAGQLGGAISASNNLKGRGFKLVGIFDNDSNIVGKKIGNTVVRHIEELADFCKAEKPKMAVLAVPQGSATDAAKLLSSLGVQAFWNFSGHIDAVCEGAVFENIHLEDSLMTLSYRMEE